MHTFHLSNQKEDAYSNKSMPEIGSFDLNDFSELVRLGMIDTHDFNVIHGLKDNFIRPEDIKQFLDLVISAHEKAMSTPGFKSDPAEKLIKALEVALDSNMGIQTYCD